MADTGFTTFDTTVQKTNELLGEIESELGWEERRTQSYSILRIVLHNLRDRLTLEKALSLAGQLTMLLKGLFMDGWNINEVPVDMDKKEFLNKIETEFQYSTDENIEDLVDKVLNIIMKSIDESERQNIRDILPEDLAKLV